MNDGGLREGARGSSVVAVPAAVRPWLEQLGALAAGQQLEAYAVGGCVRDWLLGLEETVDLDVTVTGSGVTFAKNAARQMGASLVSHEQFGTATLVVSVPAEKGSRRRRGGSEPNVVRIDIAGCRKETYSEPAAYPKVQPGELKDDLFRRDFTINAMAMALIPGQFGRLIDHFGSLEDLRAGRLRILHERSFIDDPSRILRAVRFQHRFSCMLERKTRTALQQAITDGGLGKLNRGRLRKELERMADEPDPIACLTTLGHWLDGRVSAKSETASGDAA